MSIFQKICTAELQCVSYVSSGGTRLDAGGGLQQDLDWRINADGNKYVMAGETGFVPFPSHFAPACGALMLRSSGHRVFACVLGTTRVVESGDWSCNSCH